MPAVEHVLGEPSRLPDRLDPALELGVVPLEELCARRGVGVEDHGELLEAQARSLAPHDHGDPVDVGTVETTPPSSVPRRAEQPHVLPVPQYVGRETEQRSGFSDRDRLA